MPRRLRGEPGLATTPFADGLLRAGIAVPMASDDGAPALDRQDCAALKGLC